MNRRFLALLIGSLLVGLSACSAGTAPQLEQQAVGAQAINPRDPATLRDGGDLRLPVDALPSNFNYNHVDGTEGETLELLWAIQPLVFRDGPAGPPMLDPNYLTSAEITSTAPQVVTYKIHPEATWNSGRPITWVDFEAQWRALNGTNPAYAAAGTTGYDAVASVARGADDKEVVVTFAQPFGEWQVIFSPLYPMEMNGTPDGFNSSWKTMPLDGAGPFRLESFDQVARTIVLVRNEKWWGPKPRLSRVIFIETERAALADKLANNEIDWYEIGSDINLFQRARSIPGVEIRTAPTKRYSHITFNGSPGAILEDPALRRAIAKGVDRQTIARSLIGQIQPDFQPVQNHIFTQGAVGYQDNTGGFTFDAAVARAELDALGWTQAGQFRAKDGKPLRVRFVTSAANPIAEAISRGAQQQLGQIGVEVTIEAYPSADFFDQWINPGNFDLAGFAWGSTSTPFSSTRGLYVEPKDGVVQQNYGRIYNPEIIALYDRGLRELDETARYSLANSADALIWQEMHHLPLYAQPGPHAVRATLANFGARGLGEFDYINAGFTQ